jgi:hypothetical protein
MENNRIVEIVNKKTKEKVMITWHDSLQYFEGHATFEELKEKYEGCNDKKNKL